MPTPEPPTTLRPSASFRSGPDESESPAAPAIPSFASLRGPRRRSAIDLLLSDAVSGPSAARLDPAAPAARPAPAPAAARPAPRPAEYADLVRFGIHVIRTAVFVPGRVAGWAVREPRTCLRRLLGREVR